ncbi:MAG: methyltransferase domain-containing protein [Saprospiraceae bacterium]|nr:methyltransferase domain-containing protein [Saprospiraceae bacterium]
MNWDQRWQANQTGWDLGAASPPLTAYAAQIPPEERRHLRVLIPGCGNGYEAIFLLENGFGPITMVDIAPTAVERMKARLDTVAPGWPDRLDARCADFFELSGPFDLILEQTFFCALHPSQRPDYIRKMQALLAPGGRLAGVLFDRAFEGGPPFGGSAAEYRALFEPWLEVQTLAPCYNSAAPRAGSEVFFILKKGLASLTADAANR